MSNRLADEASPYLLQHADNPVDWYPWGDEALDRARDEDKPIFLSVGYSACHWCHVMAHESFEDEQIAAILNEHFVAIKVDREERPDIDRIYMTAVQAMTGRGGWPMSVFLTPEGEPFFAGTYYPPARREGLPAFIDVLQSVIEAWEHRREEVLGVGENAVRMLNRVYARQAPRDDLQGLTQELLRSAQAGLASRYDHLHGGWGGAPKFPQPMALEYLLRRHALTEEANTLAIVEDTLLAMARGGIYDQVGGGFHRYAVDDRWLVPHFEKMLYDNAQLARVYLHAWQVTGRPLFEAVVRETLDFLLREMADPAGGFYSALDADTEGREGGYYLWTTEEIKEVLGKEQALALIKAYGLTAGGNFEGANVLAYVGDEVDRPALADLRERLWRAREKRTRPAADDKVLTSWNGLALAALAEAGRALGEPRYLEAAVRTARFLLEHLRRDDGRLLHAWRRGRAHVAGYLEDYTHLAEGLLALYAATFDPAWFREAQGLMEHAIAHLRADIGFFDTGDEHERLIVRPRELEDNVTPSGNAMACTVLLQLADLTGLDVYADLARQSMWPVQSLAAAHPLGFAQWLIAMDYALSPRLSLAVVGDPEDRATRDLIGVWEEGYHPHGVVAAGLLSGGDDVPLLRGRPQLEGHATAYLCGNAACEAPTTEPSVLRDLIAVGRGRTAAAGR